VFHASFSYQAQSWSRPRRVVAKVEWHQGELYPRVGFIVTNLTRPAERVSRFYNGRGTAEQWIKEGKQALALDAAVLPRLPGQRGAPASCSRSPTTWPTSCARSRADEVAQWSLTTLAREAREDRRPDRAPAAYVIFQLAEVAVPRALFAAILRRIDRLRGPPVAAA
jgi:hypothetical protein